MTILPSLSIQNGLIPDKPPPGNTDAAFTDPLLEKPPPSPY
jgi:hypothetical protein